jgi:hypothetical protein
MKRITIGLGLMALAMLLHGCGGNGAGGGAGITATGYAAYVRVIDPATKQPIPTAEVYFVTDTGHLPMRRVVAGQTTDPNEISLRFAQAIVSDAKEGDFVLLNIGENVVFRGLWVRRPAGYTAVVEHIPDRSKPDDKRVIQMPDSPTTLAACLAASNRAGVVKTVFGAPDPRKPLVLIDFGDLRVYPNSPQFPPPPVDDVCP